MKKIILNLFLLTICLNSFSQIVTYNYHGYVSGSGYFSVSGTTYIGGSSSGYHKYDGKYCGSFYEKEPVLSYYDILHKDLVYHDSVKMVLFGIGIGLEKDSVIKTISSSTKKIFKITGDFNNSVHQLKIDLYKYPFKYTDLSVLPNVEVYEFKKYKPNDDMIIYGFLIFKNNKLIHYEYDLFIDNDDFEIGRLYQEKFNIKMDYNTYHDAKTHLECYNGSLSYLSLNHVCFKSSVECSDYNQLKLIETEYIALLYKTKQDYLKRIYEKY